MNLLRSQVKLFHRDVFLQLVGLIVQRAVEAALLVSRQRIYRVLKIDGVGLREEEEEIMVDWNVN